MKKVFLFLSLILLAFGSCTYTKVEVPAKEDTCDTISYANDIVPIMTANCTGCHSSGFASGDFTTYAAIKLRADNGVLKNRIITQRDMPPAPATMPDSLRTIINCWISQGAPNN
ncbi:MAG: hypothetical protein JNL24_13805 [Bacteroidia bacterium]|nr:hypothetical protein [Bacteroidia bacterium]